MSEPENIDILKFLFLMWVCMAVLICLCFSLVMSRIRDISKEIKDEIWDLKKFLKNNKV